MYSRGGRQFSRGGGGGGGGGGVVTSGGGGGIGGNFRGRRRFRGQYVRSRMSPNRDIAQHHLSDEQLDQGPNSHPPHQYSQQQQQQPPPPSRGQQQRRNSYQQDIEDIKDLCSKLRVEIEQVKMRVDEIAVNLEQVKQQQIQQNHLPQTITTNGKVRRKAKVMAKSTKPAVGPKGQSVPVPASDGVTVDTTNNLPAVKDKRLNKRDYKSKMNNTKPLPPKANDDSTTQAADPSSEDKIEGEDGQGGDQRGVRRVLRRKKQHFNRGGNYRNRRRRMDSSERNSNDTSPQNELNGDDYIPRQTKNRNFAKRSFPELSENEMRETVQTLKQHFLSGEISPVKKIIHDKGPSVAQEFASAILDHAMCDVTSPTKLSDMANNLFHILISDEGGFEFHQGFYSALNEISKREDDIAIDAPRYMDTLGQLLGQSMALMNTKSHKQLLRRYLNKSLQSYAPQQSRAIFLASIMKGIACFRDERFAKDIWDLASLKWETFLPNHIEKEGAVAEFLESQDVKFTTQTFSPLPRRAKKTPEELEKFADDLTDMVEKACVPQTLSDLVKDMELEQDELSEVVGTLIYGTVRGCVVSESDDYKLNNEALNKYSNVLQSKLYIPESGTQQEKKEIHDAIALHSLASLTKLWHSYNCPQNLMSTLLLALHSHGIASTDALKTWLNSEDLKNVPGIGAARLNSKRYIEELGSARG